MAETIPTPRGDESRVKNRRVRSPPVLPDVPIDQRFAWAIEVAVGSATPTWKSRDVSRVIAAFCWEPVPIVDNIATLTSDADLVSIAEVKRRGWGRCLAEEGRCITLAPGDRLAQSDVGRVGFTSMDREAGPLFVVQWVHDSGAWFGAILLENIQEDECGGGPRVLVGPEAHECHKSAWKGDLLWGQHRRRPCAPLRRVWLMHIDLDDCGSKVHLAARVLAPCRTNDSVAPPVVVFYDALGPLAYDSCGAMGELGETRPCHLVHVGQLPALLDQWLNVL